MKQLKTISIGLACVVALLILACKNGELTDLGNGVIIPVTTDILDNRLTVRVLDGKTALPVEDNANASITLYGKDADKFYTMEGNRHKTLQSGIIDFGIRRIHWPEEGKPYEVMVVIKHPNYLETRATYYLTRKDTFRMEELSMVNMTDKPSGVEIKQVDLTGVSNGVATQNVTIDLPASANKPGGASILLKQGTQLKDENGNVITEPIKATVAIFDPTDPEALKNFPGGMAFPTSTLADGRSVGGGIFTTFGFMSLSMSTASGKEVKTFSQPLEVSMDLNPNANRDKGTAQPLVLGEKIPVWSQNDKGPAWKVETLATVEAKPGGGLTAKFSQTHLSWWNLDDLPCKNLMDWLMTSPLPAGNAPSCELCRETYPSFKIKTGITDGNPNYGNRFSVTIFNAKTKAYYKTITSDLVDGEEIGFYNGMGIDADFRIYMEATDRNTGIMYRSTEFLMCGNSSRIINFALPNPPAKPVVMLLDLATGCTTSKGQQIVVIPTVNMYYIDVTNGAPAGDFRRWRWQYMGRINRGAGVNASLIAGRKYHFAIFHGNLQWMSNNMGPDFENGLQIGNINAAGAWAFTMKNDVWRLNKSFNLMPVLDWRQFKMYSLRLRPADFTPSTELCDRFVKYFR